MNAPTLAHAHPPSTTNPATDSDGRAVEVVASFGDAVVGVRHLTQPRAESAKRLTRGLLAGGAALLATSALAFGYAANVASDNAEARDAWRAQGKPSWSFRPERLPAGWDFLTLGASLLGVAAVTAGLARRKGEQNPSHVRLGTAAGVDFPVEGVGERLDLVAPAGHGFVLNLPSGGSLPITPATRETVKVGAMKFFVSSVPAPRRTAMAGIGVDRRVAAFLGASIVAHLGLIALLRTMPADVETAAAGDGVLEGVMVNIGDDAHEEPLMDEVVGDTGAGGQGAQSARMALESGTMGQADASSTNPAKRKVKKDGPQAVARARALELARDAGILAEGSALHRNSFSSVTGDGMITSGFEDMDLEGGWEGDGTGAPRGWGNGPSGNGPGGGGHAWDSVSVGGYDTINDGDRTGDKYTIRDKDGRPRDHIKNVPVVKMTPPTCTGSAECDQSIIRRYIKRHAARITYCYEKELLAHPGLSGTVVTLFTVMTNGSVAQVSAEGVNDNVSSCVAEVISLIKFPKFNEPFQVKYPFIMHPAGS